MTTLETTNNLIADELDKAKSDIKIETNLKEENLFNDICFNSDIKTVTVGKKVKTVQKVLLIDNLITHFRLEVSPHENGLLLITQPFFSYFYIPSGYRIIIPGQYSIEKVAQFIAKNFSLCKFVLTNLKSNFDETEISETESDEELYEIEINTKIVNFVISQLKFSGVWESRGMLKAGWKNIPNDFWELISIENFSHGTSKSNSEWWQSVLLKFGNKKSIANYNSAQKWYVKSDVKKDIDKKLIPEKLNSIRFWNTTELDFKEMMQFIALGYSSKKQWAPFIKNVRKFFYEDLMLKHPREWMQEEDFDELIAYLSRCPQTSNMLSALDNLTNTGLSGNEIASLNLFTIKEITKAANFSKKFQQIYKTNDKCLNSNYNPPRLKNVINQENSENNFIWDKNTLFADFLTFPNLSSLYGNCISNYPYYENRIIKGHAHVVYHLNHTNENNGGFVAYITYDSPEYDKWGYKKFGYKPPDFSKDEEGNLLTPEEIAKKEKLELKKIKWKVEQIRSFNNKTPSEEFIKYANNVAKQISKQIPGPHPAVKEMDRKSLIKELTTDSLGLKVKEIWEKKSNDGKTFPQILTFLKLLTFAY